MDKVRDRANRGVRFGQKAGIEVPNVPEPRPDLQTDRHAGMSCRIRQPRGVIQ